MAGEYTIYDLVWDGGSKSFTSYSELREYVAASLLTRFSIYANYLGTRKLLKRDKV